MRISHLSSRDSFDDLDDDVPAIVSGSQSMTKVASEAMEFRLIKTRGGEVAAGQEHCANNVIVTSKYTILTFLPINLFTQFSRVANMYFLIIGALQLVPGLSPTAWWTTITPLILVLFINAVKEIYDDYYRHVSDRQINGRMVARLTEGVGEESVPWREVLVGDIVRVESDNELPADLVFLASSDPQGLGYVETANLDGETNLKIKNAFPGTQDLGAGPKVQDALRGAYVECEQPNNRLYQFEGSFHKVGGKAGDVQPLDANNILLRGSTLRKTNFIYGLVVFAGKESKIMKNMVDAPRKVSQLERHMNLVVICFAAALFAIALTMGVLNDVLERGWGSDPYYLESTGEFPELSPQKGGLLLQVLRYIILLNQLIPISLYVTLEMVKVIQSVLLNKDRHMYWEETATPFNTRTTNLNEELGQIEYVLSDKTGTLTQNVMCFVWASIGGALYGQDNKTGDIGEDEGLKGALERGDPAALEFVSVLATCNTVLPTASASGALVYQAASPDEEALVDGAAKLGVVLAERTNDSVRVKLAGALPGGPAASLVPLEYEVLALLDFTSARKRMSVVCRAPGGGIRLLSKGADSVMFPRLAAQQPPGGVLEATHAHIDTMCRAGYRTLCVAARDVSEEEFASWHAGFQRAQVSLTGREEMLAEAAEALERDLVLLGATAVEDKLQDGVPEAIADLLGAGIKVWMLTGDKLETACSIALSCNLLADDMSLVLAGEGVLVDGRVRENVAFLKEMARAAEEMADPATGAPGNVGVMIDGSSLMCALQPDVEDDFLALCKRCRAVVCCRVSPIQKAQVTHLVKTKAGAVTLGIGDGANDVGMIKAAHIGVGISGREGRAAVLASDYAMAQFSFLTRLLLVHGRWSYKRNREIVCYAFYKNVTYVMANVYLSFFTGFSSQPVYASALIASFNVFWTSLPTIVYGVLEQDVSAGTAARNPRLYQETQGCNAREFFKGLGGWVALGLWHSLLAFFLPLGAMSGPDAEGRAAGLWNIGIVIYSAVIITVNLKVATRTRFWAWPAHVAIWGISIGMWFPFVAICSSWTSLALVKDMLGSASLFGDPRYWLAVLLAPVAAILADLAFDAYTRARAPRPFMVYQEAEKIAGGPAGALGGGDAEKGAAGEGGGKQGGGSSALPTVMQVIAQQAGS